MFTLINGKYVSVNSSFTINEYYENPLAEKFLKNFLNILKFRKKNSAYIKVLRTDTNLAFKN